MIEFHKFLSLHKDFSDTKMIGIMNTGVTSAMNKGRTVEPLFISGEWLDVSYHRTNMSDMIRVRVSRGTKMVGEAFYFRR